MSARFTLVSEAGFSQSALFGRQWHDIAHTLSRLQPLRGAEQVHVLYRTSRQSRHEFEVLHDELDTRRGSVLRREMRGEAEFVGGAGFRVDYGDGVVDVKVLAVSPREPPYQLLVLVSPSRQDQPGRMFWLLAAQPRVSNGAYVEALHLAHEEAGFTPTQLGNIVRTPGTKLEDEVVDLAQQFLQARFPELMPQRRSPQRLTEAETARIAKRLREMR